MNSPTTRSVGVEGVVRRIVAATRRCEIFLKVDAIDAFVSWRGDGDVVFITVCDFIGIIHRRVVDHDVAAIVEVDISGVGLGATGSALRTALAWEPRNGGLYIFLARTES
jgi:hypothetical protein